MSANGGASVARCGWLTCNQPLRATDRTEAGEGICLAGHVQTGRAVITGTDYVTEAVVVHEGCTAETANTVGDQCLTCGARKQYVTQPKASEVAEDVALPCGCVPPCEGHHEDES